MLPNPPGGYLEQSRAEALLTRFVHGERADGPVRLPKRADPAQADEVVRKAFDSGKPTTREVRQCGQLMRFFDLRPRAAQIPAWLDRRESKDDEYIRSLLSVALLSDMGDDALQMQAADYYRVLASRPQAEQQFEHFIDFFFHLPESAESKWIAEPIEKKMKSLQPDLATSQNAQVAHDKLKGLHDDRLARILKARKRRLEILHHKDPARLRTELARCYLRLEMYAYVDMRQWAVTMLQRDCNENKPEPLVQAFTYWFDLLMTPAAVTGPTGQIPPEDVKSYVTSCARAIEFYGGKLSAKETDYAAKHPNPTQGDVLYWEPREPDEK